MVMVVSAYSGFFEPEDYPLIGVGALAFPAIFVVNVLLMIVWVVWRKWRTVIMMSVPFVVCAQQIYAFFPLGGIVPRFASDRQGSTFTLMTYNIMSWLDFEERKLDYNPTVSAILKADADMVALQECVSLDENRSLHITKAQEDSLHRRYPYRVVSSRDLAFLSKFPIVENTNISADDKDYAVARYGVELPCGDRVTIFNVHLKSIGLTDDDKAEYSSILSKKLVKEDVDSLKGTLRYLKHYVYPKLATANSARAAQARIINSVIKKEAGRVVLCGDFNDIPSSFAYRKVKGRMHDLYTDCGLGPTITFHANRLYFRIDQVLYKGRLLPLRIRRLPYPCSDHYPLLAEFESYN